MSYVVLNPKGKGGLELASRATLQKVEVGKFACEVCDPELGVVEPALFICRHFEGFDGKFYCCAGCMGAFFEGDGRHFPSKVGA